MGALGAHHVDVHGDNSIYKDALWIPFGRSFENMLCSVWRMLY